MDRRSSRLCGSLFGTILGYLGLAETWCREDCNRNGVFDFDDLASSLSRDCNANGVPDECEQARVRINAMTAGWQNDDGVNHETVAFDFDSDGFPDLLTAETRGTASEFALRINDRRGGFAPPLAHSARTPVLSMVTADLDSDHDIDVVAVDSIGLFWLEHTEDRGLSAPKALTASGSPRQVVALDVNAHSLPGLITVDGVAGRVSILDNYESGTFSPAGNVDVVGFPGAVAPADFDGDGATDLAVLSMNSRRLAILLNDRGGGFRRRHDHVVDSRKLTAIAAGDIDGDDDPDLIVTGWQQIFIFKNQGDGVLDEPGVYPLGARSLAAADLDGDGSLDFLLGEYSEHRVSLLLNAGDGRFYVAGEVMALGMVEALVAEDFDLDHDIDLVVTTPHEVTICSQADEMLAVRMERFNVNEEPHHGVVQDLNGDGDPDLVTADGSGGSISILHGTGDGRLTPGGSYQPGGHIFSVASADLDVDGDSEVVAADSRNDLLLVFPNLGDGALGEAVPYPTGRGPAMVILPDLDGDGLQDLASADASGDQVTIYFNEAPNGFAEPLLKSVSSRPVALSASDLNSDGFEDLAVANETAAEITFLWGDGQRDFSMTPYPVEGHPVAVACSDVDADGVADVFVATRNGRSAGGRLLVLHNDGAANFRVLHRVRLETAPTSLTVCSLSGTASFDCIVTFELEDSVTLFQGSADGTLRPNGVYRGRLRDGPRFVAVADLDRNGHRDLLVLNHLARNVTVLRQMARDLCSRPGVEPFRRGDANADGKANISDPLFVLTYLLRGGPQPSCLKAADLDDSGRLNLLDPLYSLRWLLAGGAIPPKPGATCGPDGTEDPLLCESFPLCD